MTKLFLKFFDGPIVSHIVGMVVGYLVAWFASHQITLDQTQVASITAGCTVIIAKLIQIASASSGNAVTSTIAANAHEGDS